MTIKIEIAKDGTGDRRVRLQTRLADKSGHSDIITMLEHCQKENWSQTDLIFTALDTLHAEWIKDGVYPLTPRAEYVTKEMLDIVRQAKEALRRANDILGMVGSGQISAQETRQYQDEIAKIHNQLDISAVEGAGNYAGKVKLNEDDSSDDWN